MQHFGIMYPNRHFNGFAGPCTYTFNHQWSATILRTWLWWPVPNRKIVDKSYNILQNQGGIVSCYRSVSTYIGSTQLTVVKGDQLVGIITATDILRTFIDMMGILSSTSRIDVVIDDQFGGLKKALQIINDKGGDIINVGMTAQQTGKRTYYFRLAACKTAAIRKALEKQGYEVQAAMD